MAKKVKSVLIVDDDPIQIKILEKILLDQGYELHSSEDAAKGLQMAMDLKPDMILLDVMMPVINGYNFCKLMKTENPDIYIVMVTSRDELEDIKIGLEVGADAYMGKPINKDELMRTIRVIESSMS